MALEGLPEAVADHLHWLASAIEAGDDDIGPRLSETTRLMVGSAFAVETVRRLRSRGGPLRYESWEGGGPAGYGVSAIAGDGSKVRLALALDDEGGLAFIG